MNFVIFEKGSREINEDSFAVFEGEDRKIYIVADGCGGHAAGEIASKLATDILMGQLLDCDGSAEAIHDAVNLCNLHIIEKQKDRAGMRTTVVGLFKLNDKFFAFNVGDSRLYQIRDGNVIFQTEDHLVMSSRE